MEDSEKTLWTMPTNKQKKRMEIDSIAKVLSDSLDSLDRGESVDWDKVRKLEKQMQDIEQEDKERKVERFIEESSIKLCAIYNMDRDVAKQSIYRLINSCKKGSTENLINGLSEIINCKKEEPPVGKMKTLYEWNSELMEKFSNGENVKKVVIELTKEALPTITIQYQSSADDLKVISEMFHYVQKVEKVPNGYVDSTLCNAEKEESNQ